MLPCGRSGAGRSVHRGRRFGCTASSGVEPGEDLLQALERELSEEIGWHHPLTVEPGFAAAFDYTSGSGRATRQLTFTVPAPDRTATPSGEHTACPWIDPADTHDSDPTTESIQTIHAWLRHTASKDGGPIAPTAEKDTLPLVNRQ
ncbi:NUDIX hydrolase [Nonomuraea sp. NPDC049709]|uniref:NUDIX hydrolase n=1 Tax=Nonomuraea sp. NPDC049709 TaxID=3154736 RepID=UPI00342D2BB2